MRTLRAATPVSSTEADVAEAVALVLVALGEEAKTRAGLWDAMSRPAPVVQVAVTEFSVGRMIRARLAPAHRPYVQFLLPGAA